MPPTAQSIHAVVNSDGTLARSFPRNPPAPATPHTTSTKLATGTYHVHFLHDVTACAHVATIGLSGTSGSSAAGFITVVGRAGDPNGVFVQTFDTVGALADRGFHLQESC